MISDKHREILEEIIELDGDCLIADRCNQCPFRMKCLPDLMKSDNRVMPRSERANLAMSILANEELLGVIDSSSPE